MKKRTKNLLYIGACLLFTVIVIVLFLGEVSPMYIERWSSILFYFLLTFFVFAFIKKHRFRFYFSWQKKTFTLLYFLPLIVIFIGCLIPYFIPFREWNPLLRNRFIGTVMLFAFSGFGFSFIYFIGIVSYYISRAVNKTPKLNSTGFLRYFSWAGILMMVGIVFTLNVAFFYGSARVDFKKETIILEHLPEKFDGYKIAHITDLHLGSLRPSTLEKVVDMINSQNPDIICFTGDLVTFDAVEAFPYKAILQKLKAKDGIFAILGNHDYAAYSNLPKEKRFADGELLKSFITDTLGWSLLLNACSTIEKDSAQRILIAGIENQSLEPRFVSRGDLGLTFTGQNVEDVVILLSHDPSIWEPVIVKDYPFVDITLSGHTHGRQMGLTSKKMLLKRNMQKETSMPKKGTTRKIYGFYNHDHKQYLHVSKGIGTTMMHGRLGMWADVVLIELKKGNSY